MLLDHQITKFKCATIAEAEMAAQCGAPDVLLAYQLVGPNVERFLKLIRTFPRTKFSTIADNADALRALSNQATEAKIRVEVLLDIDCGQHRTGIPSELESAQDEPLTVVVPEASLEDAKEAIEALTEPDELISEP